MWSKKYYFQQNSEGKTLKPIGATAGELPLPYTILSSASAGALASFLTSPLDMVKLRLQVQRRAELIIDSSAKGYRQNAKPNPSYRGMSDALAHSYQSGGIPGLFRGAGARVLHFVPLTTIMMTSYETCRSYVYQTMMQ